MHTARAEIGSMKPRTTCAFVKTHQMFALFKAPQKRRHGPNINGKGGQIQKMVQNPTDFAIKNADILRPPWHFDAERLFNRQRPGMFLIHWRYII